MKKFLLILCLLSLSLSVSIKRCYSSKKTNTAIRNGVKNETVIETFSDCSTKTTIKITNKDGSTKTTVKTTSGEAARDSQDDEESYYFPKKTTDSGYNNYYNGFYDNDDDDYNDNDDNDDYEDYFNPKTTTSTIDDFWSYFSPGKKQQGTPTTTTTSNTPTQTTSPTITPQSTSSELIQESFNKEMLKVHNKYRAMHQAGDLTLNEEIAKIAKEYAEYLAKTGAFEHSSNTYNGESLGENLYYCMDSRGACVTAEKSVKSWYDEIEYYNFNRPSYQKVGHFTQVVWKGTTQLGCGYASSKNEYYVVCNYYEAGNNIGDNMNYYRKNVLPKK